MIDLHVFKITPATRELMMAANAALQKLRVQLLRDTHDHEDPVQEMMSILSNVYAESFPPSMTDADRSVLLCSIAQELVRPRIKLTDPAHIDAVRALLEDAYYRSHGELYPALCAAKRLALVGTDKLS
jgi:hypothetical protein